MPLTKRDKS